MNLTEVFSYFRSHPLPRRSSSPPAGSPLPLSSRACPRRQAQRGICFFLFLIFVTLTSTSAIAATGRIECNSLPSKILTHTVNYCVILPPSYDADKSRKYP